jgi:hypothetical protein
MSAEAFLYGTLSAYAGVTAIVGAGAGARIYPDEAKEGAALPLIVYNQGTALPEFTLNNALAATQNSISVTCWAATRIAAEALADAVVLAMAAQGEIHGPRDSDFDEANQAYAAVITFTFWNR